MTADPAPAEPGLVPVHRRRLAAVYWGKVALLRLRRAVVDAAGGPRRLGRGRLPEPAHEAGASRTPLWSDTRSAERAHQLGKVQNLRRAARQLDGVVIPAGETFSFWRHVGRASRARGFAEGRMLQQGCMVPAVGGGLCQLSNALYDAALQAGCAIVERHAHSRRVPGSAAAQGRDATVAWNYVDLRFRPDRTLHLAVRLTQDELVVRLLDPGRDRDAAASKPDGTTERGEPPARSCAACAETRCFRHGRVPARLAERQAFLVDEAWPEFAAYVTAARERDSTLGAPFPEWHGRPARYGWPAAGFGRVRAAPAAALWRGVSIRLAAPGAARRRAEAAGADRLARRLAPLLTPEVTEVVVAQSYLPYLWRDGHLGGRRYSVLMTRPPMGVLHARLDAAVAAHPGRATLADHRATPELVRWEAEALAQAAALVTPHAELAALFPGRAVRLEWAQQAAALAAGARLWRIAFPGPTLARKGALDVREAALALDLEVVLLGAELEGDAFWRGVRTCRPRAGRPWWDGVAAVVQPALVEDQPRRLLAARAAGVPVVATAACGLQGPGVVLVPALDPAKLIEALRRVLTCRHDPQFWPGLPAREMAKPSMWNTSPG